MAVAKLWSIIGRLGARLSGIIIRKESFQAKPRRKIRLSLSPSPDDIFRLMINEGAGARNEISRRWKSWTRNKKGDRKKKRRRFLYLIMEKQCTPRCSTCHVHSTNNWFGGSEGEKERRLSFSLPFVPAIWSGSDSRYFHTALEHLSKRRANSSISFFFSLFFFFFERFSCRSNWFAATNEGKKIAGLETVTLSGALLDHACFRRL